MVRSKVSRNHVPTYHGGLCSLKHIIAKSNNSGHRGKLRYIRDKRGSSKTVSIVYTLKVMLLAPFNHYVLCLATESYSLFKSEFSTEWDLMLPPSKFGIFSFP